MNLTKTNLVQAQEDVQEVNEMVAMLESYRNRVVNSMAVQSSMFGGVSENSSAIFPSKPTMIEIDVTKLP